MSRAQLKLEGLVEFKQELRRTPKTLRDDAQAIVQQEGEAALSDMRSAYPAVTGNLRKGLRLTPATSGPFTAAVRIGNYAPHAILFEVGTQTREGAGGNQTGRGSRKGNKLANRGAMPAGKVFIPAKERANRRVDKRIRQLLQAHGFTVTGSAG